ncbi:conserved hypothetical protein [Ricinus communis]|uniref:Uncharacterized protein n=1 Tax=Ricinus communis TaxID=3988 RepID=B9TDW6_RICCO|nr:conserved hypothetical protein [Ricinus communis]
MYALALCLALLGVPAAWGLRLRLAFVFGLGTLAGIGISAGHWYWRMWQTYGNPLFPQFNNVFKAPLAATIGIGDTGWIPKGVGEKLLWPFIFTYHPKRVIEIEITQLIWPMLYLAGVALALRLLRDAIVAARPAAPLPRPAGLVLLFFGIAYLIWLNLFGIYRYLVPLELLAPLALWLAAQRLMAPALGRQVAGWAVLLATVATLPGVSWGHAGWTRTVTTVDLPPLPAPAQSLAFTVHGDPPMSWLVPSFPPALAFVALGGGFPESPAYAARAAAMMAARSGPFYVMLQAEGDNQKIWPAAQEVLGRYGISFDPADCVTYRAAVGRNPHPYQWCPVQPPRTGRTAPGSRPSSPAWRRDGSRAGTAGAAAGPAAGTPAPPAPAGTTPSDRPACGRAAAPAARRRPSRAARGRPVPGWWRGTAPTAASPARTPAGCRGAACPA